MTKKPRYDFPIHPKGFFVVFGGIDGCGKTSQLRRAENWYRAYVDSKPSNSSIIITKEPDKDNYWGKKIYDDLKNPQGVHSIDPFEFQRWFRMNCAETMSKNHGFLDEAKTVLQDRSHFTCCVYGAKHMAEVREYTKLARIGLGPDFIWPDIIFIFDLDPDLALARLKAGGRDLDNFEKKLEFLIHIRLMYQLFAEEYPNCVLIDANRLQEDIFAKPGGVKDLILKGLAIKRSPHSVI